MKELQYVFCNDGKVRLNGKVVPLKDLQQVQVSRVTKIRKGEFSGCLAVCISPILQQPASTYDDYDAVDNWKPPSANQDTVAATIVDASENIVDLTSETTINDDGVVDLTNPTRHLAPTKGGGGGGGRQCRVTGHAQQTRNDFLKLVGNVQPEVTVGYEKVNDNVRLTPRNRDSADNRKYKINCYACHQTFIVPASEVPPVVEGERMLYRCDRCCRR